MCRQRGSRASPWPSSSCRGGSRSGPASPFARLAAVRDAPACDRVYLSRGVTDEQDSVAYRLVYGGTDRDGSADHLERLALLQSRVVLDELVEVLLDVSPVLQFRALHADADVRGQIGRASCRE